jgi:hypothetical protein
MRSDFHFVDVAPAPSFAGLVGLHDGVLGLVEVLGGVLVGRAIAAADFAADEAHAEVNPCAADFEALFTAVRRGFHVLDFFEVMTLHGEVLVWVEMMYSW